MGERYLEDFAVGQIFVSGRLRVNKEQIKAFAAEFDPQPFHLDEEAASQNTLASAVETNGEQMSGEKLAAYLRECMRDKGWPLRTACLDKTDWWDIPECYLSHD